MKQLTVRGFEDELSKAIRRFAQREDVSLNQAALQLLREGAGLSTTAGADDTVGSSLDHLIGSWSQEEYLEVAAVLKELDVIDEEAWL
ncbi:MAG: hypothetical protein F4117_09570 [Acidimicrobiales bacterium]|nr:hypothetical protein [Acidimicrobiales bacterium]MXX43276.1 hypothetical protein [Acidimicrobiales bacterium]MYB80903.1 hypothetical protein [Acidimicrobiales bacterium]MYD34785.1 hypothetical protein [Acidimicrobiales bacterium]MYI08388.1 hypothetical protein [Acidimicrobiales bacterium]